MHQTKKTINVRNQLLDEAVTFLKTLRNENLLLEIIELTTSIRGGVYAGIKKLLNGSL